MGLCRRNIWAAKTFLISLFVGCAGCASNVVEQIDFPLHTEKRVRPFHHRQFQRIANEFKDPAKTIGPDRMVFLFDRAMALFELGLYRDSNEMLWEAERLSKISRFDTLNKLRSTSVRNQQRKFYHGDPHESPMVSVYHSLNYAFLQRDKDAINESRRALHKLVRLNQEGEGQYPIDGFYNYFAGILYERQGLWEEAYVDYKRAHKKLPNSKFLQMDLVRVAVKLESDIDIVTWSRRFDFHERDIIEAYRSLRDFGSIVVIYQNGLHAVKQSHQEYKELPVYASAENRYVGAHVYLNDKIVMQTNQILDVDALAFVDSERREKRYNSDRRQGFPLRRKKKVYDMKKRSGYQDSGVRSVKRQTEFLQADLRRWTTLPQNLQMARLYVPPGVHRVMLRLKRRDGRWGPIHDLGEVIVTKPGEVKLVSHRSFN